MNYQNKQLWDEVAYGFGQAGPTYWDEFGKKLVHYADISTDANILDIGIGRGASLFPLLKIIGNQGAVTGIDISTNMIALVKDSLKTCNHSQVRLLEMDAKTLTFEEDTFDNIVAGFSLWHALDDNQRLDSLKNILKVNGQLAFSTWGIQKDQEELSCIASDYLPTTKTNSVPKKTYTLNTAEGIEEFLESVGFRDIHVSEVVESVCYASKSQWWEDMWSNAARRVFSMIKEQGDEVFSSYQSRVDSALEALKCKDGICFKMNVIYATARK